MLLKRKKKSRQCRRKKNNKMDKLGKRINKIENKTVSFAKELYNIEVAQNDMGVSASNIDTILIAQLNKRVKALEAEVEVCRVMMAYADNKAEFYDNKNIIVALKKSLESCTSMLSFRFNA